MRVKVRTRVTTNVKDINTLTSTEKLSVAVRSSWEKTSFHQKALRKKQEAAKREEMLIVESLTQALLSAIQTHLLENTEYDEPIKEIVLGVTATYKDYLAQVLQSSSFVSYNVHVVEENPDYRRAFVRMPILVRVSKRVLGGDVT